MKRLTKFQKLKQIAKECNLLFMSNYGGRFMYNKTCPGIVTDYPDECIKKATKKGITGACTDNFGMSAIVYWPMVPGEDTTDE
jgi:hypothetical protein